MTLSGLESQNARAQVFTSVGHIPRTYSLDIPPDVPPDIPRMFSRPENRKVGRSPTHCVSWHMLASSGY